VRITRSARGIAVDGASDGRGAWLCRSADGVVPECLDAAIAARAFARAWRTAVGQDEYAEIRQRVVES
jgi:predicted RNA-binding protein YlxR (DUF448 family)